MPSFEFADCPTRLDLSLAADGRQTGAVRCTLRNTTTRRQTARIRAEPIGAASPGWFTLEGAPPTAPLEIEEDIAAGGTLTVEALVAVPAAAPAAAASFRLRVISESAPDTDFAEGPAIAFEIKPTAQPPAPKKAAFPWWAIAVAAVMLLVVVGAIVFLAWPTTLDPKLFIGKKLVDAQRIAAERGLDSVEVRPGGAAWGSTPADRIVVRFEPAGPFFEVDDGVTVPPQVMQANLPQAVQILLDSGVVPVMILGQVMPGGPTGKVLTVSPPPGAKLPAGGPAVLTVVAQPLGPFQAGMTVPCLSMPNLCGPGARAYTVQDLNAVTRERVQNREHMVDIILRGGG